jgi:hypothetical protein
LGSGEGGESNYCQNKAVNTGELMEMLAMEKRGETE